MSQLSTHQRPTPTHHHHHHHQCHHRRSYQRAIRSIRPPHRPIAPSQTTKLPPQRPSSSSRSTLSKPAGASGGTARTRPPPLLSLPLLQLLPWAKLPRRRTMEEQLQQMRPPTPRLMLVLLLSPTRPRSRNSSNSNMSTTPACTPSHSCRWRPSTQSRASARTYSAAVRCSLARSTCATTQLTHCFTQRNSAPTGTSHERTTYPRTRTTFCFARAICRCGRCVRHIDRKLARQPPVASS